MTSDENDANIATALPLTNVFSDGGLTLLAHLDSNPLARMAKQMGIQGPTSSAWAPSTPGKVAPSSKASSTNPDILGPTLPVAPGRAEKVAINTTLLRRRISLGYATFFRTSQLQGRTWPHLLLQAPRSRRSLPVQDVVICHTSDRCGLSHNQFSACVLTNDICGPNRAMLHRVWSLAWRVCIRRHVSAVCV